MGSEQSSIQRQSNLDNSQHSIRKKYMVTTSARTDLSENVENGRPGSISPGPSVCSDIDLPYISYTVNQPIGGKLIHFPIYTEMFHVLNEF